MRITKELDRIKGHGFIVTIKWGESILINRLYSPSYLRTYIVKHNGEDMKYALIRAIDDFDEKHPLLT